VLSHATELYPRVGFIVTNLARPAERVVAFYNQRGTAEQLDKEGKGPIKRTRLSCRTLAANAVRLQLHALAYNLGNFMRTLAMPKAAEPRSLTSLQEKLIKIDAKVVSYGRFVTFQDGRGRGVAPDLRRNPGADRPAAGVARASITEAVVRCDGRWCWVQLGGPTVNITRVLLPTAAIGCFGGSAETLAAHRRGRSRVQLVIWRI
jgi:hypothetical protein